MTRRRRTRHAPATHSARWLARLDAARPPDEHSWQVVTLSFEHERAAAQRLAGFGGRVEVLAPPSVRELLLAAAQEILDRYRS